MRSSQLMSDYLEAITNLLFGFFLFIGMEVIYFEAD